MKMTAYREFEIILQNTTDLIKLKKQAGILTISDLPVFKDLLGFVLINKNQKVDDLSSYSKSFQRSVCGKELNSTSAIKCQTCSNDLSSVICMDCFDADKHIGHKFN